MENYNEQNESKYNLDVAKQISKKWSTKKKVLTGIVAGAVLLGGLVYGRYKVYDTFNGMTEFSESFKWLDDFQKKYGSR